MFAKLEGLEKKYMELEQALAQPPQVHKKPKKPIYKNNKFDKKI